MDDDARADEQGPLGEARRIIARQVEEIEHLRRRLADEQFAKALGEALRLGATASTIASPVGHPRLLEIIVETAACVINARAASLFLIDEATQELVFAVALGEKAAEVKKFRVPLGHGIAGLVAASGQSMAVADAKSDPRHAADIAHSIGYAPQSILCVPLFYHEQVIGVLELLDKEGAPSFSAADMEALGLFANQAAVAIELSRTRRNVTALLTDVLESLGGVPDSQKRRFQEQARAFATGVEAEPASTSVLGLARLVQEIAQRGEPELNACRAILRSFADYLRSQSIGEHGTMR